MYETKRYATREARILANDLSFELTKTGLSRLAQANQYLNPNESLEAIVRACFTAGCSIYAKAHGVEPITDDLRKLLNNILSQKPMTSEEFAQTQARARHGAN